MPSRRKFETNLARDDDALISSQFFEALAEIERRRAQETIEVEAEIDAEGQTLTLGWSSALQRAVGSV